LLAKNGAYTNLVHAQVDGSNTHSSGAHAVGVAC
jgi:hypothetical protein